MTSVTCSALEEKNLGVNLQYYDYNVHMYVVSNALSIFRTRDIDEFVTLVQETRYKEQNTNTASGLRMARTEIFQERNGMCKYYIGDFKIWIQCFSLPAWETKHLFYLA